MERNPTMKRDTVLWGLAAVAAAFFLVFGLWPFFDARSFYNEIADFPPYNPHFLHDIGAFQVGLGATFVFALLRRTDALFAALGGVGVGATLHFVAHVRDHSLGGSDADTVFLGVLGILLLAGAAWKWAGPREAQRSV